MRIDIANILPLAAACVQISAEGGAGPKQLRQISQQEQHSAYGQAAQGHYGQPQVDQQKQLPDQPAQQLQYRPGSYAEAMQAAANAYAKAQAAAADTYLQAQSAVAEAHKQLAYGALEKEQPTCRVSLTSMPTSQPEISATDYAVAVKAAAEAYATAQQAARSSCPPCEAGQKIAQQQPSVHDAPMDERSRQRQPVYGPPALQKISPPCQQQQMPYATEQANVPLRKWHCRYKKRVVQGGY